MVQMTGSGPVLRNFIKKWFSGNVNLLYSEGEKRHFHIFFKMLLLERNVPQRSNIHLNNSFNQSGETSENSRHFAKLRNLC